MGLLRSFLRSWQHRSLRRQLARRLDPDPAAVAQILLLFRMVLADGMLREPKMRAFEAICRWSFGIAPYEMAPLHSYLERHQREGDREKRMAVLRGLPLADRLRLVGFMEQIAASCGGGSSPPQPDMQFIRQAAIALGVAGGAGAPGHVGDATFIAAASFDRAGRLD